MSTAVPEAPAVPQGEAPTETAPPAPSPTPDAPPAQPPTTPPAPTDQDTPEPRLETVDDLGDGPDGDPVEGEDQVAKIKRIARREAKEKREITASLISERDEAITRAETAETALSEAQAAAVELPAVKDKLASAELDLLRYTVGSDKGLTMKQASRLKGSTVEEIEADAAAFIAENAMPGAEPKAPQTEADRQAFIARMNRNRR